MKIAFDIDDTLIVPSIATTDNGGLDTPNYETIAIYKWFGLGANVGRKAWTRTVYCTEKGSRNCLSNIWSRMQRSGMYKP